MPEVVEFIDALRRRDRRAGADRHDRDRRAAASTAATASTTDDGRLGGADRGAGERRLQPSRTCRRRRRRARRRWSRSRRSTTGAPDQLPDGPGARRRRVGDRASSSPTRSIAPGRAGHARRRRARAHAAHLPGPRHHVVDGRDGRPRRALRRGRRPRPRPQRPLAAARRARPTARTLDLNALTRAGRRARRPARRDPRRRRPVLRVAAQRLRRSPTSSWSGCSTDSTSGRSAAASTATLEPPHRLEPTRVDDAAAAHARPAQRRDRDDRVGDRVPAGLLVAARCRCSTARASSATTAASCTGAPGLYAIGLNFLRRRKSSFIHGAEDDARELTDHLAAYLGEAL